VPMATCVPGGGDECLREPQRAVREDDARAVIINSSHQGHYPDEDAAKPRLQGSPLSRSRLHTGDVGRVAAEYETAAAIPAAHCCSMAVSGERTASALFIHSYVANPNR
jgi:hypothetical protein